MLGSGVDPGATVEGKERDLEPQSLQYCGVDKHHTHIESGKMDARSPEWVSPQVRRKCRPARICYGVTVKHLPWSHILRLLWNIPLHCMTIYHCDWFNKLKRIYS